MTFWCAVVLSMMGINLITMLSCILPALLPQNGVVDDVE
jgi:hypothetical protein